MKKEPVAWIDEETGCFVYSQYDYEDLDEHGKDGLIPLYTHPVQKPMMVLDGNRVYPAFKELTDEEIWKCHDETDSDNWVIDFARAILRKAQEK